MRAITLFTRVAGCSGRPGALSLHAAVRVTLMVLSRRSREMCISSKWTVGLTAPGKRGVQNLKASTDGRTETNVVCEVEEQAPAQACAVFPGGTSS